jgi:hypothetical protein
MLITLSDSSRERPGGEVVRFRGDWKSSYNLDTYIVKC